MRKIYDSKKKLYDIFIIFAVLSSRADIEKFLQESGF